MPSRDGQVVRLNRTVMRRTEGNRGGRGWLQAVDLGPTPETGVPPDHTYARWAGGAFEPGRYEEAQGQAARPGRRSELGRPDHARGGMPRSPVRARRSREQAGRSGDGARLVDLGSMPRSAARSNHA